MQLQTAFKDRVRSHPEELLDIFRSLTDIYNEAKKLRRVDANLASLRFEELLNKVHVLQSLPADTVPLDYTNWSHHLSRIYNLCQGEREGIQRSEQKLAAIHRMTNPTDAALAASMLHDSAPLDGTTRSQPSHNAVTTNDTDATIVPWIHDWDDPTLQSETVRRLVRRVVVPMMFPESVGAHMGNCNHTILIDGPANVGKSWTIASIQNYLQSHHVPIQWKEWTAYDCPEQACILLKNFRSTPTPTPTSTPTTWNSDLHASTAAAEDKNEWTVYVTDRVSVEEDLCRWATQPWFSAWYKHISRLPRTIWIVIATTDTPPTVGANDEQLHKGNSPSETKKALESHPQLKRVFSERYTFGYPDSPTVFHYIKRLVCRHYSCTREDGSSYFPPFARLPIVHELPQLAEFVDRICSDTGQCSPDFQAIDRMFHNAMDSCARLALSGNVVYGISDTDARNTEETCIRTKQDGGGGGSKSERNRGGDMLQRGLATAATHHWYPKTSVNIHGLPDNYDYRLIAPLRHDTFDWCPCMDAKKENACQTEPVSFWNTQLFDSLPGAEYDRLVHLYIDPDSVLPPEKEDKSRNDVVPQHESDKKTTSKDHKGNDQAPSSSPLAPEPTYSIIANFPITTRIFPYHLHSGFDRCYEWTLSLWMATVHAQREHRWGDGHVHPKNKMSRATTIPDNRPRSVSSDVDIMAHWRALRSMGDVSQSPDYAWKEWFLESIYGSVQTPTGTRPRVNSKQKTQFGREPEHEGRRLVSQFSNIRSSSVVLYVESIEFKARKHTANKPAAEGNHITNDVENSDTHQTTPLFHLTCAGKSTVEIPEYRNGIPGNIQAETLRTVLQDLCEHADCDVVQVQTHSGYAYYIDFQTATNTNMQSIQCIQTRAANKHTSSVLMPRVSLLSPRDGVDLDKEYRLTTESDVDILTETFPRAYKDVFRDEEHTWKLQPVRHPEHLAVLNSKYSNEEKCYLKMFCDLMRAKERHYAVLKTSVRTLLDDALIDLQNHLDYLLQIIPERDRHGKWNSVWSMSKDHPGFHRYHPPSHDEVDKVIPLDVAAEWLRRGAVFSVSPRLLEAFYAVTSSFVEQPQQQRSHEHDDNEPNYSPPIQDIFQTWRTYIHGEVSEQTQWVYVKSTVSAEQWSNAKSASKLIDRGLVSVTSTSTSTSTSTDFQSDTVSGLHQPLSCLEDAKWMRAYASRTGNDSLFHTLLRNAEHIGHHDPHTHNIRWNTFTQTTQEEDPLNATLTALQQEPTLWSVLSSSCSQSKEVCHPWLFALCQTSLNIPPTSNSWQSQNRMRSEHSHGNSIRPTTKRNPNVNYRELYGHLLFFNTLHYWTLRPLNILDDIQRQPFLDQFVRQYAYIHRSVYKRPLELRGKHPGVYVRQAIQPAPFASLAPKTSRETKKVIDPSEMDLVRVYGLSLHHLMDAYHSIER